MGNLCHQYPCLLCLLLLTHHLTWSTLTTPIQEVSSTGRSVLIHQGTDHGIEQGREAAFIAPETNQLVGYARSVNVLKQKSFWYFTELTLPSKLQKGASLEILLWESLMLKRTVPPFKPLLRVTSPPLEEGGWEEISFIKRRESVDWFHFTGRKEWDNPRKDVPITLSTTWVKDGSQRSSYSLRPLNHRESKPHTPLSSQTIIERAEEEYRQKQYRQIVQYLLRQRRAHEEHLDFTAGYQLAW